MPTLEVKKYNQEGDMAHEYRALRNKILAGQAQESETGERIAAKDLTDFRTKEISVDLNNPLNIECQPSYDGTVNLIINDDEHPPRIINSRFSAIEDNRYRIINRNQKEQTNIYEETLIDQQTRLFRNIQLIPRIQLMSVDYFGQLKGGNYTFYVKFADNDFNKTDIVCESGQVSIFNGTLSSPRTIQGTLQDERTDKAISIRINNIDTSFQKVYLYYTRETSDINGIRTSEAVMIKEPYDIKNSYLDITINGFEEIEKISDEELNIKYLYVDRVKTQAQNQGMLFFGNVEMTTVEPRDFQNLSLYINVKLKQKEDSIGYVDTNYNPKDSDDSEMTEYYNPQNIYYSLGYWPDEMYRLGIVYIMRDDSLTEVFNLRGIKFGNLDQLNVNTLYPNWYSKEGLDLDDNGDLILINGNPSRDGDSIEWSEVGISYIPKDDFIQNGTNLDNIMGVFKLPNNVKIWDHENKTTKPLGFEISFPDGLREKLRSMGVKGFFIVRQKRIPTILCQGLSVGVDRAGHIPMLPIFTTSGNGEDERITGIKYITEGFLDDSGTLSTNFKKKTTSYKATSALLTVDAPCTPSLQSTFDGSEYTLQEYEPRIITESSSRVFTAEYRSAPLKNYYSRTDEKWQTDMFSKVNTIYVAGDVPFKYMSNQNFSTRCGAAEEVKQVSFFDSQDYKADNRKLLRGIWCPILGLGSSVRDGWIYNVKIRNFSKVFEQEYFKIRGNDNSQFFAITDRYSIDTEFTEKSALTAFRGDCYTCTVSMRIQRNFIDSDVPTNEIIIDPNTWKNNYNGYNTTDEDAWLSINRGDVNSCPMGHWITWKCFSNYNLGLRALDSTNVEEMALMGNARSFYPISGASTSPANKIEESWKLNDGYSATVGKKAFLPVQDVPYVRDIFDTRIMFSNVQQNDAFQNAYRIFQGLSFKDMDRQYGGIVKLITWGSNLLCIFEHGITIIPVNEKALLSTNTGQSIHMYGAEVLQDQMTVISQDYGSIWQESIIRTPVGVYGVDTYAKKIWRFSADKGLELISDAKIQRFLNDNIKLKEKDKYPIIALKNVKSHYNNYKGDIMFTFYNDSEDSEWNICYNERLDKWSTRYSWIPLYSENVNNIYYSLDKKRAEVLAYIYDNINASSGIISSTAGSNEWVDITKDHTITLTVNAYNMYKWFSYKINAVKSSYINGDGVEEIINIPLYLKDDGNYYLTEDSETPVIEVIQNSKYNPDGTLETPSKEGKFRLDKALLNPYGQQLYYLTFIITATPYTTASSGTDQKISTGESFDTIYGIVVKYLQEGVDKDKYDALLRNGFYVHGRAGIFDEIDYFDYNPDNQIMPTKWYDVQEPFEFEFVVNEATGLHKIFNNLVIISNNVAPEEIEFEIIGDVYHFNKAGIFRQLNDTSTTDSEWNQLLNPIKTASNGTRYQTSQEFKNTEIEWDPILNQYNLKIKESCWPINDPQFGRRRGNIHYKEDAWYLNIDPIKYTEKYKIVGEETPKTKDNIEARIRDKWVRIRIKYTGKDLVLISAIKTMFTVSYA